MFIGGGAMFIGGGPSRPRGGPQCAAARSGVAPGRLQPGSSQAPCRLRAGSGLAPGRLRAGSGQAPGDVALTQPPGSARPGTLDVTGRRRPYPSRCSPIALGNSDSVIRRRSAPASRSHGAWVIPTSPNAPARPARECPRATACRRAPRHGHPATAHLHGAARLHATAHLHGAAHLHPGAAYLHRRRRAPSPPAPRTFTPDAASRSPRRLRIERAARDQRPSPLSTGYSVRLQSTYDPSYSTTS
jgi:hypothetical protein